MAAKVDISTVEAQNQFKNLREQTRAVFQQMQILSEEFERNAALAQRLGFMLASKLTPEERRFAAVTRSADSALLKQDKAMNAVRERAKNLAQAIKLSNAANQQQKVLLQSVNQSLKAFEKTMSSGVLTTRQQQKAQDRLNKSFGTAKRDLATITAGQKAQATAARQGSAATRAQAVSMKAAAAAARVQDKSMRALGVQMQRMLRSQQMATKSGKGFTANLRNIGSSAIFAVGPLSGIGARINALGAIVTRSNIRVAIFSGSLVALGVVAFKLTSAMVKTGLELFRIRSSLRAATDSAVEAARQFNFVAETSAELGVNLKSTGLQFAQLSAAAKGSSLAGEETERVFTAVSTAAVVLGLTSEQTQGALRAIQQMMSKGTVQAEELRGQLGERLPGAFNLAAKAMGVTTQELGKMLEKGEVLAEDLLPKLATELMKTFGPQIGAATAGLSSRMGALATEITLLLDAMEQRLSVMQTFAQLLDDIGGAVKGLRKEIKPTAEGLREELEVAFAKVEANLQGFTLSGKGALDVISRAILEVNQRILGLPVTKEPLLDLGENLLQVQRLINLLEQLGVDVTAFRRRAAGITGVVDISAKRATPGLVATGGRGEAGVEKVIGGVGLSPSFSKEFVKARGEMLRALKPMEAMAEAALVTENTVRIQTELTKRLADLNLTEATAKKTVVDQLREIIKRELAAKDAVQRRLDLIKETNRLAAQQDKDRLAAFKRGDKVIAQDIKDREKAEKKAFAAVVAAAFQQDKDRLDAFKRGDKVIAKLNEERKKREKKASDAVIKAAVEQDKLKLKESQFGKALLRDAAKRAQVLQSELVTAQSVLKIQQMTELSTKERTRLIQIEHKFQQELQKARAGGLPIVAGTAEFQQLRAAVVLFIDAKLALKELVEEENEAEKAFAAVVKGAVQQDKDRIDAVKRGKVIITSQEKAKAAFASRTKIAERSLAIERNALLTEEEKIRLVAQMTLFERELFAQRKAGVPLVSEREKADLREATDKIVEMKEKLADLKEVQQANKDLARDFSRVIGSAFEDAIIQGDSFRDVLKGILDDITRIILRTQVTKPFETFLTGQMSGLSGLGNLFGGNTTASVSTSGRAAFAGTSIPGGRGGFAHGGRPPSDKISIVGEQGPELFKPDVPGTIIPLKPGGGFGMEVERFDAPRAVDVTERSPEVRALGAILSAFSGPIGAAFGAVTRGFLGRFGVRGGSLTPPVQTDLFSQTVKAGRQAEIGNVISGMGFLSAGIRGAEGFGGSTSGFGRGPSSGLGAGGGKGDAGVGGGFGGGGGGRAGSAGTSERGGIGGFERGGRPVPGQTSAVGEGGPELFFPDSLRSFSPANANAPTSIVINQRFDFRGASLEAVALLRRESARIREETIAEVTRRRVRGITAARR